MALQWHVNKIIIESEKSMQYENLPNDPVMLLSFINLKLRDEFNTFSELCKSMSYDADNIIKKLKMIDYEYDEEQNQFI